MGNNHDKANQLLAPVLLAAFLALTAGTGAHGVPLERALKFPADCYLGDLWTSKSGRRVYVGKARGIVTVPPDTILILKSVYLIPKCIRNMSQIKPDDIDTLDLASSSVTDADLVCLERLNGLRGLIVDHTSIHDSGLKSVGSLKKLTSLSLRETLVESLPDLSKQTSLKVFDGSLTHIADDSISRLPLSLQELSLSGTSISNGAMKQIAKMKHLRSLDLSNTAITLSGLREIATHPNLAALKLNGCKDAGTLGLSIYRSMPKLRSVRIENVALDNAGIDRLMHQRPELKISAFDKPEESKAKNEEETLETLNAEACAKRDEGKYAAAQKLFQELLDRTVNSPLANDQRLSRTLLDVAQMCIAQKKDDEALRYLRKLEALKAPDKAVLAGAKYNKGDVYTRRKDWKSVEKAMFECMALNKGKGHSQQLQIWASSGLAGAFEEQKKWTEAIHWRRQAVTAAHAVSIPSADAATIQNLGYTLTLAGNLKEGKRLLKQSVDLWIKCDENDDTRLVSPLCQLALCCRLSKEPKEAISIYRRVQSILKRNHIKDDNVSKAIIEASNGK